MIIQGSPEILQGPRGLNSQFGAFSAISADDAYAVYMQARASSVDAAGALLDFSGYRGAATQESIDAANNLQRQLIRESLASIGYTLDANNEPVKMGTAIAADPICGPGYAWDGQMCRATGFVDPDFYGGSPDFEVEPAAVFTYTSSIPAVPKDVALRLAYQSSTGGVSTALFDQYGGYEAVMQAAAQYGYSNTPAWIQNYELSNGLPESAYTKLNKQFVGPTGEDKFQQLQEDLLSKNRAIAEQARADVAAQTAAAEAAFAKQQQATIDKIIAERKVLAAEADAAFARQEAANKKTIADAYAAAQAASKAAVEASTLSAKQAADALRVRALVAVKALYLQVLGREGDQAGLDYFADRFGDVIDPDELQIFSDMAQPEIDARNKYLADMASKSKEDAAKAKAIADQFAATAAAAKAKADAATAAAAKAKADAAAAIGKVVDTTTGGSGGISPMLILAAAAAAFFIGG